MALDKFNWQNGSQVEPAKVEIEGVSYDVVDAQYEGETPLSASNLNLMQDTLLSNVVDDLEDESKIASCKAVKDIYSTSEVKTNKTWIDGKPIYRKTFFVSTLPNASTLAISSGLDINNTNVVKLEGIGQGGDNIFSLNCPASSPSASNWLRLFGNKSSSTDELMINIATGSDRRTMSGNVIVEYTKTTD